MQSNNKLTIPDLISIGVFTAIYFVLVTIATFASALLLPGVSNIFLPAIAALISGSVYMLLAAKLQKTCDFSADLCHEKPSCKV